MSTNHIRSKWAAVGAAVAVSLGAGGIGITQATTSSGEKPIYLPIEPCRLADTRAEFQVGPRSAPLGPNETYTLSGQGAVGDCTLPAGTTALSLNVTAINATEPTFVTLFPAGASLPVASHLNPLPGQGAVPNAVNVDLSAGGEFSVYNLQGNVDIIVDVVGIYDDHTHDDRYYQKSEVDAAIALTKSINLLTLANVDGNTADSPWGSTPGLDTTVMLPPDYTPGSAMVLRTLVITDSDPCDLRVRGNYSYGFRDTLGNLDDDGGSVSGMIGSDQTVSMPSTGGRSARLVEFPIGPGGTISLAPGDALSLGLFFGGTSTCNLTQSHFHAAELVYG